jgi:glycosyltransferase involved in cell wall biosynthesis
VGFIPEGQLRSAYVHADLTAFPSRYGFGLATLESMACGTPTVSGRTLDAPEFIGDAGLMADPNDAGELATQIIRGLVDSELRENLIRRGLEKSGAYHWQQMAVETAAVYRTLL